MLGCHGSGTAASRGLPEHRKVKFSRAIVTPRRVTFHSEPAIFYSEPAIFSPGSEQKIPRIRETFRSASEIWNSKRFLLHSHNSTCERSR